MTQALSALPRYAGRSRGAPGNTSQKTFHKPTPE